MKKIWLLLLPLSLCLAACGDEVEEILGDLNPDTPSDSIPNSDTPSDSIQNPGTPSDSIQYPGTPSDSIQ